MHTSKNIRNKNTIIRKNTFIQQLPKQVSRFMFL